MVVYISYNIGIQDLPDIYAHALGPAALGLGHIYQANFSCPCYNYHSYRKYFDGGNIDGCTSLRNMTGKILMDSILGHLYWKLLKGKILTECYRSIKSVNISPHQKVALYGIT